MVYKGRFKLVVVVFFKRTYRNALSQIPYLCSEHLTIMAQKGLRNFSLVWFTYTWTYKKAHSPQNSSNS